MGKLASIMSSVRPTSRQSKTGWLFLLLTISFSIVAEASDGGLDAEAHRVLRQYCYRCHGVDQKTAEFNVLDLQSLTKVRDAKGRRFVTPGNAALSDLWAVVDRDKAPMPPSDSPEAGRMTASERITLRRWIDAGAKFPTSRKRPIRSTLDDLTAIREYLLLASPPKRRRLRFLTLSHLANDNELYSERDLRLVRAAVSKLLNSVSWKSEIVVPNVVPGTNGAVLALNLRDLGWTGADEWLQVVSDYPYGLKYDYVKDQRLKQAAADVRELVGGEPSLIRADWFVVAAARPKLYHALLRLPESIKPLEARVGVDVEANILAGEVVRAGVGRSRVSRQNRLLERHESRFGAYWLSYNFMPRRGRGDLIRYPLGPKFEANRFNRHAFHHDGGGAIFHLPNGLQGYFLVDGDGQRLDGPAPADVMYDKSAIAGTPAIVNGLSCIHCHREGMVGGFRDEIRNANAIAGAPLERVKQLYVEQRRMDELITRDRKQFLTALRAATAPFLCVGDDVGRDVVDFPEPIGRVAQRYLADLGPEQVAFELGVRSIDDVRTQIQNDRDLRKLGLGALIQANPGTIKRDRWEAIDGTSFFQDAAMELRLGTPILPGTTRSRRGHLTRRQ